MNSPTQIYLATNKYVASLKVLTLAGKRRKLNPDLIELLILRKCKEFLRFYSFAKEVFFNIKYYRRMWRLRNHYINKKVLVLGNGPSQGFVTEKALVDFFESGNHLCVVNNFYKNKIFSRVIPTYLVISDPGSLNFNDPDYIEESKDLLSYLLDNTSVNLLCPLSRCKEISELIGENRVIGFVDTEMRLNTNNITPVFPRGYLSMTLYKALAFSLWACYKEVFILGMDNTYPRDIYCNSDNEILNLEVHVYCDDSCSSLSQLYNSVGDRLVELSHLFYDARKFNHRHIINLDPYSLTDAFRKYKGKLEDLDLFINFKE